VTESDEVMRRVAARLDEVMADASALDSVRSEIEGIGRQLAQSRRSTANSPQLEAKLDELQATVEGLSLGNGSGSLSDIATALHDDIVASVQEEMAALRAELANSNDNTDVGSVVAAALDEAINVVRKEIQSLDLSGGAVPDLSALGEELGTELVALRTEVVQLKRRLGVRGRPTPSTPLDESQISDLADHIVAGMQPSALSDDDVARIVEALGAHLERAFEVVEDPVEAAPSKPAAGKTTSQRQRR
jgi:hypothetical protein